MTTPLTAIELLHQAGARNPRPKTIRPYQQWINRQLGSDSLFKTQLDGKGIARGKAHQLFAQVFKLGPHDRLLWGAHHFFRTLIDKDVDILTPDGRVDRAELTRYAYKMDQLGNRNGKVESVELFSAAIARLRQYIPDEAKRVGLTQRMQDKLNALLKSRAFGVSGPSLEESFDLGKRNLSLEAFGGKLSDIWANMLSSRRLFTEDSVQQDQALKLILRRFAHTGIMPIIVKKAKRRALQEYRYVMVDASKRMPLMKVGILRHTNTLRTHPEISLSPVLRKTQVALPPVSLRSHGNYHITTQDFKSARTPAARQLIADLDQRAQSIADALTEPHNIEHLRHLLREYPRHLGFAGTLDNALHPLFQAVAKALELQPKTRFKVLNDITPGVTGGITYAMYAASNFSEESIEGWLLKNSIVFSHAEVLNTLQGRDEDTTRPHTSKETVYREDAQHLIAVLVEECMHAEQSQSKKRFPELRQADYRIAERTDDLSPNLSMAVAGHASFYDENPMEVDAKYVADKVIDLLKQKRVFSA